MRKRIKKVSALILAVSLLCSAFVLPEVYAATRVETERKDCSIVVSLANNVYSEEGATEFRELEMLKVDVDLYKVATIAENGKYTAVDTYKDVTVFPQNEGKENSFGEWINKKLDSKTPAGDWADVAKMLKPVAETTSVTKKGSMEEGQSSVKIENLETGLYLVNAHAEKSENYEYQFMPYLISLPNNYYDEDVQNSSDAWIYEDVAVGLKPEKHDRYGDLKVIKDLRAYNATTEGAYFTFRVQATKIDVDTEEVRFEYDEVFSLELNSAGTKEFTLTRIPAGAQVVVTEIVETITKPDGTPEYKSGASYELISENNQQTTIIADTLVTVDFTNTYDNGLNDSDGKVNQFRASWNEATNEWVWYCEAVDDTAAAEDEYNVVVPEPETTVSPSSMIQ